MARGYDDGWAPYVPVAQRRRQAEREAAALKKQGQACHPVAIAGRTIARSFWGKAWCDNLEAYSDYANRLPRGRTYVRNGSVIDLSIANGRVQALVSGSEIYRVEVSVHALEAPAWNAIVGECTGQVASLIEVLQGRLSKAVMEVVTRPGKGLFPLPRQLGFRCSCPDSASMCKHVAATLYGVGARLDDEPELLFRLRQVEPTDLIRSVGTAPAITPRSAQGPLAGTDLSALFGIDLADASTEPAEPRPRAARPAGAARQSPPAPATTKSTAKSTASKPKRSKTITAGELIARGIPRHMIQAWLSSGVLERSGQRGVYRTTRHTASRIDGYIRRGGGA